MISTSRRRGHSYKERKAIASRRIRRIVISLVMFLIYLAFSTSVSTPLKINSAAMEPTLKPGDRVLYSRLLLEAQSRFSRFGNFGIERGDLLVISPPYFRENQRILDLLNPVVRFFTLQKMQFSSYSRYDWENSYMVKRVVALPGDTVKIVNHRVFIKTSDSTIFSPEEDLIKAPYQWQSLSFPQQWNDSFPFNGQMDSYTLKEDEYFFLSDFRGTGSDSYHWGALQKDRILGKLFFRYWPFNTVTLL